MTVKGVKRGSGRGQAHNGQTGPDETNLDRRELANGASNLDSEGTQNSVQTWVLGCGKLPSTATTSRHQPQDDWCLDIHSTCIQTQTLANNAYTHITTINDMHTQRATTSTLTSNNFHTYHSLAHTYHSEGLSYNTYAVRRPDRSSMATGNFRWVGACLAPRGRAFEGPP